MDVDAGAELDGFTGEARADAELPGPGKFVLSRQAVAKLQFVHLTVTARR